MKGSGIDPKELSNAGWMDQPQGDRKSQPDEQSDVRNRPEEYYIGEGPEAEGNQQGQGDPVALSVQ
eukprot:3483177-Karenia_brevis.AAC.1